MIRRLLERFGLKSPANAVPPTPKPTYTPRGESVRYSVYTQPPSPSVPPTPSYTRPPPNSATPPTDANNSVLPAVVAYSLLSSSDDLPLPSYTPSYTSDSSYSSYDSGAGDWSSSSSCGSDF